MVSSLEYDALVRLGYTKLAMLAEVQDPYRESYARWLSIEDERQYFSISQTDER
jgi:hypothetical protein